MCCVDRAYSSGDSVCQDSRAGKKYETYLILICCSHTLHDLFGLAFGNSTLLRQNLGQDSVDLACHVGSVTANIEKSLLHQQFVNLFCLLL